MMTRYVCPGCGRPRIGKTAKRWYIARQRAEEEFDFDQVDPLGDLWKAVNSYICRWYTESDEEWHARFAKPGDPMPEDPRMPLRPRPGKTAKIWYRKARRRAEARRQGRRAARMQQKAIDAMWVRLVGNWFEPERTNRGVPAEPPASPAVASAPTPVPAAPPAASDSRRGPRAGASQAGAVLPDLVLFEH